MTFRRTLSTLAASALLLGAAPALAGEAAAHPCDASCGCARKVEAPHDGGAQAARGATAGTPHGATAQAAQRDAEFLQAVWSSP